MNHLVPIVLFWLLPIPISLTPIQLIEHYRFVLCMTHILIRVSPRHIVMRMVLNMRKGLVRRWMVPTHRLVCAATAAIIRLWVVKVVIQQPTQQKEILRLLEQEIIIKQKEMVLVLLLDMTILPQGRILLWELDKQIQQEEVGQRLLLENPILPMDNRPSSVQEIPIKQWVILHQFLVVHIMWPVGRPPFVWAGRQTRLRVTMQLQWVSRQMPTRIDLL
mmetsp:Transcript_13911/g.15511  ORF Transcript_13911/g.15511 Transcript_13911/m.15511 type:complete len:219 (+) Transcript_13911:695-1351(+)